MFNTLFFQYLYEFTLEIFLCKTKVKFILVYFQMFKNIESFYKSLNFIRTASLNDIK